MTFYVYTMVYGDFQKQINNYSNCLFSERIVETKRWYCYSRLDWLSWWRRSNRWLRRVCASSANQERIENFCIFTSGDWRVMRGKRRTWKRAENNIHNDCNIVDIAVIRCIHSTQELHDLFSAFSFLDSMTASWYSIEDFIVLFVSWRSYREGHNTRWKLSRILHVSRINT